MNLTILIDDGKGLIRLGIPIDRAPREGELLELHFDDVTKYIKEDDRADVTEQIDLDGLWRVKSARRVLKMLLWQATVEEVVELERAPVN